MKCAVHNCTNRKEKKQKPSEQLSFFQFPKAADILHKWVSFCRKNRRDKLKVTTNTVICIEHFKEDDIQETMQFQMGLCSKRTLRPGAVPCINKNDVSVVEREQSEKRKNKKLLNELLEEAAAREAAEANGEIFVASDFKGNTSINSPPDYFSATGNVFHHFTPTPSENDPLAEEHIEELDLFSKSITQSERLYEGMKCRTCCALFVIDENCKDLCDSQNAVMLYHINIITGIWIQCIDGISAVICSNCVDSLQAAIEFRETCIQTELQLSKGIVDDIPNVISESKLESLDDQDELSSGIDGTDNYVSVCTKIDENGQSTAIEPLPRVARKLTVQAVAPTALDPNNHALGAQINEDLLNEDKVMDKTKRPRQKKVKDLSQKSMAKQRMGAQPEQQKRTKEEQKRIRNEQLRALPLDYVCDQCGACFRQRYNLTTHMLRHTRTKNYTCPECPKKFYNAYLRNIHQRVEHKGELPYACNHCNKAFVSSSTRYLHEKNVHKAAPRIPTNRVNERLKKKLDRQKGFIRHECNYCGKSYSTKFKLDWHVNRHTGTMPFKCKFCDIRFHEPHSKYSHEQKHDGKPFECDICQKGFYARSQLKQHERVHTGERPYRCDVCNVSFRYRVNLYSHQFCKMHKENVKKPAKFEDNDESK